MLKDVAKAAVESSIMQKLLLRLDSFPTGRKLLNRLSSPRGVFETYEQAEAVARATGVPSHENPGNVAAHMETAKNLLISDYPVLHWMNQLKCNELRVADYGGSGGNLYYAYRPLLHAERVHWTVLELPKIMEEGVAIAAQRAAHELHFLPSSGLFPSCDFVLVSGAFHYWKGSAGEFVARFPQPPEHIIINRSPIVHGDVPHHYTVQHSEYSSLACIIKNKNEITADFHGEGYELIDQWACPEYPAKKILFPRFTVNQCTGLYFRKR
ncbi:MAG: hypothetical protein NVS9B4_12410 [Candidatus Acidiferrum sp.]